MSEKNNEYLNEEKYQKAKKKITKISLIILIVGLVIGLGLMATGAILQSSADKANEKTGTADSTATQDGLSTISEQKKELDEQIAAKQYECDSIAMGELDSSAMSGYSMNPSWYAEKSKCQNELSSLKSDLSSLESKEFGLTAQSQAYDVMDGFSDRLGLPSMDSTVNSVINSVIYAPFYMGGAAVILLSCLTAGIFYLVAKKREIESFFIQQTMPVAQETIGKMAPTVGNAAGEVAKGIKKGLKDEE